jgi:hypothetical protein
LLYSVALGKTTDFFWFWIWAFLGGLVLDLDLDCRVFFRLQRYYLFWRQSNFLLNQAQ